MDPARPDRGLRDLVSSRRQYTLFMLATAATLWMGTVAMVAALVTHVVIWAAVIHAITIDIRDARNRAR